MKGFHIGRIKASNFKGFENIDITLNRFNVITGPGRSELLQIFFLPWYIRRTGYKSTVGLHDWRGPAPDGEDSTMSVEYHFKSDSPIRLFKDHVSKHCRITTNAIVYRLSLRFSKTHCHMINSQITADYTLLTPRSETQGRMFVDMDKIRTEPPGDFTIDSTPVVDHTYDQLVFAYPEITGFVSPEWDAFLRGMSVHDFVCPEFLKSGSITGRQELDCHGTNLSDVLRHVTADPDMKETLCSRARDLIPSFEEIRIRETPDSATYCVKKEGSVPVPADEVSETDARILALLACVILPRTFVAIESPERGISTGTARKIIRMMAGQTGCQIIITGDVMDEGSGDALDVSRDDRGLHVSVAGDSEIKRL